MCVSNIDKVLEKNLSFHSSGDSSSATKDTGGSFSIWPNITLQKSLRCGVMMGHWPNFTLLPVKRYPKLRGKGVPLNLLIFVGTNYH